MCRMLSPQGLERSNGTACYRRALICRFDPLGYEPSASTVLYARSSAGRRPFGRSSRWPWRAAQYMAQRLLGANAAEQGAIQFGDILTLAQPSPALARATVGDGWLEDHHRSGKAGERG
eukprot:5960297-Prymnesium_polylepis.2